MNTAPSIDLFRQLTRIANEVSLGDYTNIGDIFELTKEQEFPAEVATMAEALGMMIVRVDAKQQHLERLIEDLNQANRELALFSSRLVQANIGILESLGSAVAKRDSDTNAHNYRVTILATHLGRALKLPEACQQGLIKGSFLHDLGKIAIRDAVLLKPGQLTDEEFSIMKTHVLHGSDIITAYEWLQDAYDVVHHHHEKYNGQGYPDGLRGDEIPVNARIFSIVDVFDALVSKRPYKQAYSFEVAMGELAAGRGEHFDPEFLDTFIEMAPQLHDMISGIDGHELTTLLRGLMRDHFDHQLLSYYPHAPTAADGAR